MPLPGDPGPEDTASPAIALDPEALDFGAVAIGDQATGEVEVCNVGDATLQILSVAADEGEAVAAGPLWAGTVEPGQCTALEVTFAPVVIGPAEDTVWLESNDPTEPLASVALAGEGVGED